MKTNESTTEHLSQVTNEKNTKLFRMN